MRGSARETLNKYAALLDKSAHTMPTEVSTLFFGDDNIEVLQSEIQRLIKKKMGKDIGRQSDEELLTIMRSLYSRYADPRAVDPRREVSEMNNVVLRTCLPIIASAASAYDAYVRDASQMHTPLERGVQTSTKGTKTLQTFRPLLPPNNTNPGIYGIQYMDSYAPV